MSNVDRKQEAMGEKDECSLESVSKDEEEDVCDLEPYSKDEKNDLLDLEVRVTDSPVQGSSPIKPAEVSNSEGELSVRQCMSGINEYLVSSTLNVFVSYS